MLYFCINNICCQLKKNSGIVESSWCIKGKRIILQAVNNPYHVCVKVVITRVKVLAVKVHNNVNA